MSETTTQIICPYCGHSQTDAMRCESCRGLFEPLSRQATQNAMGPWFVRDESQPFRPGCSYETLVRLVERGRVTAGSIIRGPATHQFWMRADHVPGLAHLFGLCHSCGERVGREDVCCEFCGAMFTGEQDRQAMGLLPVRDLESMAGRGPAKAPEDQSGRLASVGYDRLRAAVEAGAIKPPGGEAGEGAAPPAEDAADLAAAVASMPRQPRHRRVRRDLLESDAIAARTRRERRLFIIQACLALLMIAAAAILLLWVLVRAGALALPFDVPGTGVREADRPADGHATEPAGPPGEAGESETGGAAPVPSDDEASEDSANQPPPPSADLPPGQRELLDLYSEAVRLADGTTIGELERAEALLRRVHEELPEHLHPEDLAGQQRKVARRLERLRGEPDDG